jgi:hypothetical protein
MKTEREIEARLREEEEREKEREKRLMGEESEDSDREERQVENQTDSKHPAEKGEYMILYFFAITSWMCRLFVHIGRWYLVSKVQCSTFSIAVLLSIQCLYSIGLCSEFPLLPVVS